MPGVVTAVNLAKMTVQVQPTIMAYVRAQDGTQSWVKLPQLLDVPIVFPCAGGFAFTLPIAIGDEVLVVFASRCIDAWWQSGSKDANGNPLPSVQAELRMHDLSDGFAIPGPQSIPNVLPNISATTCQMRKRDGSAYVELTADGKVNIVAPGGFKVTGVAEVTGKITADAGVDVTGTVQATVEVLANGHHLTSHIHGGVQTGGGTTGTPIG